MIHCETNPNDPTKIITDIQGTGSDIDQEMVHLLFSYICHKTEFLEEKSLMSLITDHSSGKYKGNGGYLAFIHDVIGIIKPITDDVGIETVKLAVDPSTANCYSELIRQPENFDM